MELKVYKQVIYLIAISLAGHLSGCATGLEPVRYSSSANKTQILNNIEESIQKSFSLQVDVLAPNSFEKAIGYLEEAKEKSSSGAESWDVWDQIGLTQAYLSQANQEANRARPFFTGLLQARKDALTAGSQNYKDEFEDLDEEFIELTEDPDSLQEIKEQQKVYIQDGYLELELAAIKKNYLEEVENVLREAKSNGAEETVPLAYQKAIQKLNIAQKTIETERHHSQNIRQASQEALAEALRVEQLREAALKSTHQSPEERAKALESKDQSLEAAQARQRQWSQALISRDQDLRDEKSKTESLSASNASYKKEEAERQMVQKAAARFDKEEADVYVQGGDLVIRLKQIHFASGRSDLPQNSLATLAKVKEILMELQPKMVQIQGHTDSLGSKDLNQALSQDRARIVAKHFTVDQVLDSNQVEVTGFGYSSPIASNKTKLGRAKNRRVDVLIQTP